MLSDDWDQSLSEPPAYAVFDGKGGYRLFFDDVEAADFASEVDGLDPDGVPHLVYPLYAGDGLNPDSVT